MKAKAEHHCTACGRRSPESFIVIDKIDIVICPSCQNEHVKTIRKDMDYQEDLETSKG